MADCIEGREGFTVAISRNALIDRLRKLQSDLTAANEHTDALVIDLAIQIISSSKMNGDKLVDIMKAAFAAEMFDKELADAARRVSARWGV